MIEELMNEMNESIPAADGVLSVSAGKRGAFRASDHDANWSDDTWTLSQMGPNNPKKLKKSKSKDESSPGSVSPFISVQSCPSVHSR